MTVPLIDLRDPRFQTDRDAFIKEFRSRGFFARTAVGAVVFFDQEDVVELLSCRDFRFTFNLIDAEKSPYLARAIENELLNMHGAAHARLSRLLKMALRDRIFEGLRDRVDSIAEELVENLPEHSDFCADFADPLPARVLGPMFGIPYSRVAGLNDWIRIGGRKIDALQSGVGIAEVEDANRKIHEYLRALLAERREDPGEDLFSELIAAEIDGDRMSDDELVFLTAELASAGVDTTRAQLPLILNALLDHPDQMAALRADPGLALRAVDEGMRFAPLPFVLPHAAIRDFTYRGIEFRTGDLAFAMVPAANRDPKVVDRPDEFDISRPRVRHFGFGHGMHGCPGAQLARMEMASALAHLMTETRSLERDGDPVWEPGHVGRTLAALPIRLRR